MSQSILQDVKTGVLFKNPAPHLKSIHAFFPSVVLLPEGGLLATYMMGEAFEAVNCRVRYSRSDDPGQTWREEGAVTQDLDGVVWSESARMTVTPDGEVIVLLHRHDRSGHPDEGLANPETLGFVPTRFDLTRSSDGGQTWTAPQTIKPPLVGPAFELCSPITILSDGRWILPTSTWSDWEGNLPNGNRMVAFVSEDQGKSWPSYLDVMHHESNKIRYWESKIVELAEGTLLAVAWGYDETTAGDLPNQYAISRDGGLTWTSPESTGLTGQTMTPHVLDNGRILCVYRRMDEPGLWAQMVRLDGDRWINEGAEPLWGRQVAGLTSSRQSMVHNFQVLRFGAPCITALSDGSLFVAFWCYEDCVGLIRWYRFRVA